MGLSGLWVIEEPLGTSAERLSTFCFASAVWAWQRGRVTPAKEVPIVPTKVKAEKQSSVKGRSAGIWEGEGQWKEELFFSWTKNRSLFSHTSSGTENSVSGVIYLKQDELFSGSSEISLPVREQPPDTGFMSIPATGFMTSRGVPANMLSRAASL